MNSSRRSKLLFLPPLILISVFASLFLLTESVTKTTPEAHHHHHHLHVQNHLQTARSTCQGTLHPDLCVSTLSKFPDFQKKSVADIISATVNLTINLVHSSSSSCKSIRNHLHAVPLIQRRAIDDCLELLSETVDELKSGVSDLSSVQKGSHSRYSDIQTLLSGAMTNQDTCLDGFAHASNKTLRKIIQPGLVNVSHHVSNSLALLKKIAPVASRPTYYEMDGDGFPRWLSRKDRRLLQEAGDGTTLNYDLVVAKDGTGNFTTIGEAVEAAPNRSEVRFVIYIKAGAYFENVEVISQKTMLMFVGDGIGKTLVKAGRNVVDGWTTFNSATVAVVGNGFIAKGITFENYAGPSKHQAVALRSNSDHSAFYKCSFVAYQDTLYVHSLRQFYRDCDIYGTIDFVFGNAAAVLQNCNLYARRPNPRQSNVFTAQGRSDPNENTGISILNCKVAAAEDLIPVVSEFRNYLGRPWKEYSRTVYLLSYIDSLIDPAGWLEWDGDFALATLYYGEYMNRGPGANTSARVTWPGYRVINSSTEANQFTVGSFIEGGEWLPPTGIPFYLGLSSP